jgi:O-glycosyl hydrolase
MYLTGRGINVKIFSKFACIALTAALLVSGLAPVSAAGIKTYNVTVLPDKYQTVKGWGVFPSSVTDQWLNKYAAHTGIYRDLGITQFRIEVRGNCGDADGNLVQEYMDTLSAHIQTAVNNGVSEYMVSIWSPPAGMKTNNKIEGLNEDGTAAALLPEKEEAFAKYLVKVFNEIKRRGLPIPIAFSLQNEPNNAFGYYQCCYYTMEQYQRVCKLIRKTFDGAGYKDIRMMGTEGAEYKSNVMWLGNDFSEFEKDAEFEKSLDIIASHSYYNRQSTQKRDIDAYVANLKKYPGKEVWQTEFSTAHNLAVDNEIDRAIGAMGIFATDMAWVGNNVWYWWSGWDFRRPAQAAHQEDILFGDGITSTEKSLIFQCFAKVWKNVPVGSEVLRMKTDDSAVVNTSMPESDMVAFGGGGRTVALFINSSKEDKIYNFDGLTGVSAEVYTAVSTESGLAEIANRNLTDGKLNGVFAPARSVTVIVTQAKDKAPPEIKYEKDKTLGYDNGVYVSRQPTVNLNLEIDEQAGLTVNKSRVKLNGGLTYSQEIKLGEKSVTEIRLDAEDTSGNQTPPVFLKFRYDPKYVGVAIAKNEDTTNDENYILSGSVNIKSNLTINGEPVELDGGLNFAHPLEPEQGENSYSIIAADDSGNKSKEVVFKLFCDSDEPQITVSNTDFTTTDSEYVITGQLSEPVKYLEVNGKDVKVKDDLTFITKIGLFEGANTVTLKAADFYENAGEKELVLTYGKIKESPHATDALSYTRKAASKITVDGKLDEDDWVIDNKANKVISGAPDNIVNFGTLWDKNYLYIGAVIYDTVLIFDDERVYQNDCFEVFINPSNEKKGAYGEKDKQLFVGYPKNRIGLYANSGADYKSGWSDFEGGYTVELAIPWSSTGITPGDGVKAGFDIAVDDKDSEGARESVTAWAGTSDNWQDTSSFGTLILTSETEVTYKDKPENTGDDESGNGEGSETASEIRVLIPGGEVSFTDARPQIIDGIVMLPLRVTAESMGGRVDWLNETNEAVVTVFGVNKFSLFAGGAEVSADGAAFTIEKPAVFIGGRLFVPAGFIEKAFGLTGMWDEKTNIFTFKQRG